MPRLLGFERSLPPADIIPCNSAEAPGFPPGGARSAASLGQCCVLVLQEILPLSYHVCDKCRLEDDTWMRPLGSVSYCARIVCLLLLEPTIASPRGPLPKRASRRST